MRRRMKQQCVDTLHILKEAHAETLEYISKGLTTEAASLLGDCQEGAISVGNAIEGEEGEGTQEVHILEEYCEKLFQVHNTIVAENPSSMEEVKSGIEVLDKLIDDAISGIEVRLPLTKEVVFMPYKASMWDSLESVWRKMSQDEAYHTVVVPIPYFDKNPDGSFRKMHYEALQYPPDVPVVSYESYSLEENRPDAIYIHNPYDDCNFVTSVHPDFYSDKLKKYTDELVYIPYFVLGEVDPSNKAAVEGMKHFVTVPACINADRVIVQSEDMRQVYVDILTEWTNENARPYWEKKVEGTGSPKFDRVENLKESDFEIPDEWKKNVLKKDGTRKKIIFYNTGIAALLESRDEMLDKIERNFEVFKENGDSVSLLWRPHPLIEATLASMLPALWQRYKRIVDKYIEEGWGIYDDSPELDRAIALSDAYYGDPSSVVQLYKKTGKPIMIQNVMV